MDNIDRAARFRKVADDFERLVNEHGLHNTAVDMTEFRDRRHPDIPLCDTPACHGGWSAIMYGVEVDLGDDFYAYGADLLAWKLGFGDREALIMWAGDNPQHWGGGCGDLMFCCELAFGKRPGETLTLLDIIDWYRAVADRLQTAGH